MRYFRISPARKIFENVQVFISKGCVCYNILGILQKKITLTSPARLR